LFVDYCGCFAAVAAVENVLILHCCSGCLIVFGQTASGKSHTMTGPANDVGITPRMVDTLFHMIENADANVEFQFKVSYVEIYKEMLRDLLDANAKPRIREEPGGRGIFLSDTTVYHAANQQEVFDVLNFGLQRRTTAYTNMNADSSRSHSIFVITVEQTNIDTGNRRSGRLFLVDCAGSESVARTGFDTVVPSMPLPSTRRCLVVSQDQQAMCSMKRKTSIDRCRHWATSLARSATASHTFPIATAS
jgi:hypothetical protein